MRSSTTQIYQQSLASMQQESLAVANAQNQVSSGLKWQTAGTDPAAFASAQGFDQMVAANAQYTSNAQSAQTRLQLSESAIGSSVDVIQQAQQLALQANTASQSDTSRAALAQQLSSLRDQLVSLANSSDGQGRYLFGGTADAQPPFSWNGSNASYSGNTATTTQQVGSERYVAQNDPGSSIFQGIATGNGSFSVSAPATNTGTATVTAATLTNAGQWDNGSYNVQFTAANQYQIVDSGNNVLQSGSYTDGGAIAFRGISLTVSGTPAAGDSIAVGPATTQDAFTIVDQLAKLIAQPQGTAAQRAQVQTGIQQSIASLQAVQDRLSNVRSSIGTRLDAVQNAITIAGTLSTSATTAAANLRQADYASSVTELQQHTVALQAAQQSYVKVSGLSLFNYLN